MWECESGEIDVRLQNSHRLDVLEAVFADAADVGRGNRGIVPGNGLTLKKHLATDNAVVGIFSIVVTGTVRCLRQYSTVFHPLFHDLLLHADDA